MRSSVVVPVVAVVVLAGLSAGAARTAPAPAAAVAPVSFVPIGSFPERDADALAGYFGRSLGLRAGVLPRAALPRTAFDAARRQYVAERLIGVLHKPAGDPRVVIGLTDEDMYWAAKPEWRYTFSIRSPQGFAVVSAARMDPRADGLFPDPGLRMRRLRKMVLKNIGVLAYGRAPSGNPRSALYDRILGPDDLDYMSTDFDPRAPTGARLAWLNATGAVCRRGVARGKAVVARFVLTGIRTPADFLRFANAGIALDERERAALAAVPAAPEDRAAVAALLARYRAQIRRDRAAVGRLRARWSAAAANRFLGDDVRSALGLKSNALELGSRSCARYFDPATYSR